MLKTKTTIPLEIKFSEGSNHKITSSAQFFNKKGNSFFLKGEYSQAIRLYFKALNLAPNTGVIHYNIALCFIHLNGKPKAAKHFKMAKQYANGDKRILNSTLTIKFLD